MQQNVVDCSLSNISFIGNNKEMNTIVAKNKEENLNSSGKLIKFQMKNQLDTEPTYVFSSLFHPAPQSNLLLHIFLASVN